MFGEFGGDGGAFGVVDAFGDGDQTAALCLEDAVDVGDELVQVKRSFGHVDQVRAVAVLPPRQRRGGRQETGVPAHDHVDLDAGQRLVVKVVAGKSAGDEPRGRTEPGGVIVALKVVVDRFGNVKRAQFVTGRLGFFVDDAAGVRGVVAAGVEEVADVVLFEGFQNFLAVGIVGFVTAGTERRGRRDRDPVQRGLVQALQFHKIVFDDAADRVAGAEDLLDLGRFFENLNRADQRLVDHCGGTARLTDDCIAFQTHGLLPSGLQIKEGR